MVTSAATNDQKLTFSANQYRPFLWVQLEKDLKLSVWFFLVQNTQIHLRFLSFDYSFYSLNLSFWHLDLLHSFLCSTRNPLNWCLFKITLILLIVIDIKVYCTPILKFGKVIRSAHPSYSLGLRFNLLHMSVMFIESDRYTRWLHYSGMMAS